MTYIMRGMLSAPFSARRPHIAGVHSMELALAFMGLVQDQATESLSSLQVSHNEVDGWCNV